MTRARTSFRNGGLAVALIWSVTRIAGASIVLAPYHVNIAIFAVIELISSPILAVASANMVFAQRDRHLPRAGALAAISLAAFAAPDIYLLRSGRGLPWVAYAIVVGVMTLAGALSLIGLRRQMLTAKVTG